MWTGHLSSVQACILDGIDIDSLDKYGKTALHAAVIKGSIQLVHLLLANFANVQPFDVLGQTPLRVAVKDNHVGIARALLEYGANVDIPHSYQRTLV